jgi:hypothetical protein
VTTKQRLENLWTAIVTHPDVVAGTIQIITALVGVLIAAISRKKVPST